MVSQVFKRTYGKASCLIKICFVTIFISFVVAAYSQSNAAAAGFTGLLGVDEMENLTTLTDADFVDFMLQNHCHVSDTAGDVKAFYCTAVNDTAKNYISRTLVARNVVITCKTTNANYYASFKKSLINMAYVFFKSQKNKTETVYYYMLKPYIAFVAEPLDTTGKVTYSVSMSKVRAWY